MGLIKIYQGKSKAKRKPGWEKEQAEYQAWLAKTKSMSSGIRPSRPKTDKIINPVVSAPVVSADRLCKAPSVVTPGGAGTKPVARPDILYKDDPELLARELAARARKFNVAPAYNKGPTIYVSEDEITNQLVGGRRR